MHILFSEGYEDGRSIGLNFIKGSVRKIENTNLKLPNIGWKKNFDRKKHRSTVF